MTPEEAIDYLLDPIGKREKHDDAIRMAIDALQKQMPKKPVMDYQFPEKLREVIERTNIDLAKSKTECCPVCGRPLEVSKFVQSKTGLRFGNLYCKNCGQAIDWSDGG